MGTIPGIYGTLPLRELGGLPSQGQAAAYNRWWGPGSSSLDGPVSEE